MMFNRYWKWLLIFTNVLVHLHKMRHPCIVLIHSISLRISHVLRNVDYETGYCSQALKSVKYHIIIKIENYLCSSHSFQKSHQILVLAIVFKKPHDFQQIGTDSSVSTKKVRTRVLWFFSWLSLKKLKWALLLENSVLLFSQKPSLAGGKPFIPARLGFREKRKLIF